MEHINEVGLLLHTFLINVPKSAVSSGILSKLISLFTFDPVPCEGYYDAWLEP